MTLRRLPWDRIALVALLVLVVLVVAACAAPGTRRRRPGPATPHPTPTHAPPLEPAQPGADPISFLAWLFTPIFKAMFIVLVAVYDFLTALGVPAAIGWAIVALTLLVRTIVIPLYRRQLVSQRRMQLLQPEIKEIQRRYKGDSVKARVAQQELFKERGISPLAGCLPLLLQMPLLFIMYSVIQNGLTNVNPSAMLDVFGVQVVPLTCNNINPATGHAGRDPRTMHQHDHPVPRHLDRRQPAVDDLLGRARRVRARHQHPGHRLGRSPARPVADDAAADAARGRRPEHEDPAPDDAVPAARSRSSTAGSCRPACSSTGSRRRSSRSPSNTSSSVGAGCSRCSGGRRGSRRTTPRDSRSRCPHHLNQANARRS